MHGIMVLVNGLHILTIFDLSSRDL